VESLRNTRPKPALWVMWDGFTNGTFKTVPSYSGRLALPSRTLLGHSSSRQIPGSSSTQLSAGEVWIESPSYPALRARASTGPVRLAGELCHTRFVTMRKAVFLEAGLMPPMFLDLGRIHTAVFPARTWSSARKSL